MNKGQTVTRNKRHIKKKTIAAEQFLRYQLLKSSGCNKINDDIYRPYEQNIRRKTYSTPHLVVGQEKWCNVTHINNTNTDSKENLAKANKK